MNLSEEALAKMLARNPALRIAGSAGTENAPARVRLEELQRQATTEQPPRTLAGDRQREKDTAGPVPLEDEEHETVADWLTAKGVEFHHSPNGGKRPQSTKEGKDGKPITYSVEAQKLKRMGTKAGFPDILIIDRPPRYPEAPGAVVEMKRRKGGTLSADQKKMLGKFAARGWRTFVAKGADQAIAWLQEQGY